MWRRTQRMGRRCLVHRPCCIGRCACCVMCVGMCVVYVLHVNIMCSSVTACAARHMVVRAVALTTRVAPCVRVCVCVPDAVFARSVPLLLVAVLGTAFVLGLLVYHTWLVVTNQTTNEQVHAYECWCCTRNCCVGASCCDWCVVVVMVCWVAVLWLMLWLLVYCLLSCGGCHVVVVLSLMCLWMVCCG